jgi:hypothetical protein
VSGFSEIFQKIYLIILKASQYSATLCVFVYVVGRGMRGVNLHNVQWKLYLPVKYLRVDQLEGHPNWHAVEENISIAVQVN